MNLEISVEYDKWNEVLADLSLVQSCVAAVFAEASAMNNKDDDKEICFLFTSDDEIRVLNRTYRAVDKPTNVLSFPVSSEGVEDGVLGSIVLAFETIQREAVGQGKPLVDHLRHLIVHGMLHLIGYDHLDDAEADQMEALEVKILQKFGVKNPYE
ncbi:MAG: rRNA maturation RNase YbeY [Holosporaceae bacterium]|jgi:probable rRNA maturation factor|nr:rRNA maturation RNase YbeY [Holosporaceae bacterium]